MGPPTGIEAFYKGAGDTGPDGQRIAVYDGTNWRLALNQVTAWGAWQDLILRPGITDLAAWPAVYRVNPYIRKIELAGIVEQVGSIAWATASDTEITGDTALGTQYAPQPGSLSYAQTGTSQVTFATSVATANVRIQQVTTPNRVGIFMRWQGNAGGGNWISLDGIEWWY